MRISIRATSFLALACCWLLVSACERYECGENSSSVLWARSLSGERLEELYSQISARANAGDEYIRVKKVSSESPPEIDDLNYHSIFLMPPLRAQISLAGCFDEYVIIYFEGIYNDETPAIRLQWSDSGSEILWKDGA